MLSLILPLGLVILAIGKLRDPQFAKRFNAFFSPEQGIAASDVTAVDQSAKVAPVKRGAKKTQLPGVRGATQQADYTLPGVEPSLLKTIQDNTYFRNAEKDAWFNFLDVVKRAPTNQTAASQAVTVDYVQLVDQPDVYRGKLVTIHGIARQVSRQTPSENNLGIDHYYRVVVQPSDGNHWPIIVYALSLPDGIEMGEGQSQPVRVVGLFFKKLSYRWRDGLGTAPVIVAGGLILEDEALQATSMATRAATGDLHNQANDEPDRLPRPSDSGDEQSPVPSFREILSLAGWSAERFAAIDDGGPFTDEQLGEALQLLFRLRKFDSVRLSQWMTPRVTPVDVLENAEEYRGELIRVRGTARSVTARKLAPQDARRLELDEYYVCEIHLEDGTSIEVIAGRVPRDWLSMRQLEEPVILNALVLKGGQDGEADSIWLAKEIEWRPGESAGKESVKATVEDREAAELNTQQGKMLLGAFMDVGLLDGIQSRGPIRSEEREVFYEMLTGVGQFSSQQLVRYAQQNLPAVLEEWKAREAVSKTQAERALARIAIGLGSQKQYSVATLFNDSANQVGRLFVFDGVAKRAVRVSVGTDSKSSDIADRFGFDHYYEIEVFTNDSQNYPVIFCVRRLPEGFPVGSLIDVPVRAAGFFFKDWRYKIRNSNERDDVSGVAAATDRVQYAPLLIGAEPIVLKGTVPVGDGLGPWIGGSLFLLSLAGLWLGAMWLARGDRQFREKRLEAKLTSTGGANLNDILTQQHEGH